MPTMHRVEPGEVLNPWSEVVARLSRLQDNWKNERGPRLQDQAFRKMITGFDLVLPLVQAEWLNSFPRGTLIPQVDQLDLREVVERLKATREWADCTWTVIRDQLIQRFADKGVECPKHAPHALTYLEWRRQLVKLLIDKTGDDAESDHWDLFEAWDMGETPEQTVTRYTSNPS